MKLTLAKKISLALLLFALPISHLLWSLVDQQQTAIEFVLKELEGNAQLRAVRAIQFSLNRYRVGETDHLSALALDAQSLAAAQAMLGGEAREQVVAASQALQAVGSPEADVAASVALRQLTARIGDVSNLILDPDLDSFYVMDQLVARLPGLIDQLTEATSAAVEAATSPPARDRLIASVALLKGTAEALEQSGKAAVVGIRRQPSPHHGRSVRASVRSIARVAGPDRGCCGGQHRAGLGRTDARRPGELWVDCRWGTGSPADTAFAGLPTCAGPDAGRDGSAVRRRGHSHHSHPHVRRDPADPDGDQRDGQPDEG